MLKNVGLTDRILRVIFALVLSVLILTGAVSGILAVVLGILSAVFLVTGLVGTCPIYLALNLSTYRKEEKV